MESWYTKNFTIYTENRSEEVWTLYSEQCELSFSELLIVFQIYGVAQFQGHDEKNDYMIYTTDTAFYELSFDSLEKCWTLMGGYDNNNTIKLMDTPDYDYLRMLLLKSKIENSTEDKSATSKRTKL